MGTTRMSSGRLAPGVWLALCRTAVSLLAALAASLALAHGDWKPQHGGILNDGETTFEFVLGDTGAEIYISDHGEPLPSSGASGALEVAIGGRVLTHALQPAGDNKLTVRWDRAPDKGTKLMARVVLGDGSIRVGRIQLK